MSNCGGDLGQPLLALRRTLACLLTPGQELNALGGDEAGRSSGHCC